MAQRWLRPMWRSRFARVPIRPIMRCWLSAAPVPFMPAPLPRDWESARFWCLPTPAFSALSGFIISVQINRFARDEGARVADGLILAND